MKSAKTPWWRSSTKLPFVAFLAIAGYFLWTEHQAHITPYLVWILLIACLVLHRFMHGGHGHGGDHEPDKGDDNR